MFSCDIQNVVDALPWNKDVRDIKWLSINFAVDIEDTQAPELSLVDVVGRQNCLVHVLPGARVVVMPGQHANLSLNSAAEIRAAGSRHVPQRDSRFTKRIVFIV